MRTRAVFGNALITALPVLAGCQNFETPNVGKDYALSAASGKGVVVDSITSKGLIADYRLWYRQIGGDKKGFFQLYSLDPALNASLIVAELPAGDYEIYKWSIYWSLPSQPLRFGSAEPFSIPFHVAPGEAEYIGSCTFGFVPPFGPLAPKVSKGWERDAAGIVCSDESQRDLMELETRYPGLRKIVRQPQLSGEFYRSNNHWVEAVPIF